MTSVNEQKYVKLFYTLLKANPNMNITEPTQEEVDYVTGLSYLLDEFANVFGFEYELEEGKLVSRQVKNSLTFIKMDFEGIVSTLSTLKEQVYDEDVKYYVIEHFIGNNKIKDKEYITDFSNALYIKRLYNAKNFGDAKKSLTKDKLLEKVNVEKLKEIWKELNKYVEGIETKRNNS